MQKIISILCATIVTISSFAQISFYSGAASEVALNEQYQVVFVLENANGTNFTPPSFEGFRVINGPFVGSFSSNVNGQVTSTLSYKYVLQAMREGEMTIASASIKVGGNTLYTEKIELTVLPAKEVQQVQQSQTQQNTQQSKEKASSNIDWKEQVKDRLLVRLYTDNEQPYVGEQVFVTAKLYMAVNTQGTQLTAMPEFEGFWKQEIEFYQDEPEIEVLDGQQYQTYLIAKYALFPLKEGKYILDPVEMKSILTIQSPGEIRYNFFGMPVQTYDYEQVEYDYASNPLSIEARALPLENKPDNFIGAVGSFKLKTSIDSTSLNYGSPLRWKATLSGTGNVMSIQEPELEFPRFVEVYDPEIRENISKKSNYVNGSKSYEYILVPKRPGTYSIPSLGFSYFDPEKEEYISLYSPEYPIVVKGEMPEEKEEDIEENIIETYELSELLTNNDLRKPKDDFYGSSTFYVSMSLPFALFGFFLLAMRFKDNHQVDLKALKNKRALKEAKKRLEKAKTFLDSKNKEAFYTEIFDAFNGYVSDKLAINQAELNKDYVLERFQEKEIPEELGRQFIQVLSNAEEALYSPASANKMQEDYNIAIQWIVNIEHEIA